MKNETANRLAQGIQLLKLSGYDEYTDAQLSSTTGVSKKTIQRNKDLIIQIDFALDIKRYQQCLLIA